MFTLTITLKLPSSYYTHTYSLKTNTKYKSNFVMLNNYMFSIVPRLLINPPVLCINFAANEWQNFLLYIAVPLMHRFLPERYFKTLQKLVRAVTILLGDEIAIAELNEADRLLQEFITEFQVQYGREYMVMNMHVLGHHTIQGSKAFGPLWAYWCYPYEGMLGYVKRFIHSTRRPEEGFVFGCQVSSVLPVMEAKQSKKMAQHMTPKKQEVYIVVLFSLIN